MLDRPSHGFAPPNTHAHAHVQAHTCTPAVPPGSEPLWQETQSCSLWSVSAEHLLAECLALNKPVRSMFSWTNNWGLQPQIYTYDDRVL